MIVLIIGKLLGQMQVPTTQCYALRSDYFLRAVLEWVDDMSRAKPRLI